jgi:hypothetical protein
VNFEGGDPARKELVRLSPPPKVIRHQLPRSTNVKLIREGTIQFETENISASRLLVDSLCRVFSAFIQEEKKFDNDYQVSQELVVRIPAEQYENFVLEIERHAYRLTDKNIKVIDVTDEFIDVQARLKTKYDLENRYRDLLKKAVNVEEMLAVEAQISGVRLEIESMEGRMRSLSDRITYSTLTVSFNVLLEPHQTAFTAKLKVALIAGWQNLLSIFVGLVFLWPFIIFFTFLGFIYVRLRKRKSMRPATTP